MGPGRPHPGVRMVLPWALDLRRAGPADIWPQAPRGSPGAEALPHLPPSSTCACPSLHSLLLLPFPMEVSCSTFCLPCPSLISRLVSFCQATCAHTHTYFTQLHVLTPTLTSPHVHMHPETLTHLHTPSHKAHTLTHVHTFPSAQTHTAVRFSHTLATLTYTRALD